MKNIIWLAILASFITDITCIDAGQNILSKFHQSKFKIKDFRVDLIRYNEEYYNFFEIKTFKYNRTTPAINVTFSQKIDLKDKIEVLVQAYKFLSNEYRHFPVRFQVNLQKAYLANAIGLKTIRNCGNITSFIFEKDVTYHACNFVIDSGHFPPLIPNGRFRVNCHLLYLNEEIAVIYFYGEVYTPFPYPKN